MAIREWLRIKDPNFTATDFLYSLRDRKYASMYLGFKVKNNYTSVGGDDCISRCNDFPFNF